MRLEARQAFMICVHTICAARSTVVLFCLLLCLVFASACDVKRVGTQSIEISVLESRSKLAAENVLVSAAPSKRPGPRSRWLLTEEQYLVQFAGDGTVTNSAGQATLEFRLHVMKSGPLIWFRLDRPALRDVVSGKEYLFRVAGDHVDILKGTMHPGVTLSGDHYDVRVLQINPPESRE